MEEDTHSQDWDWEEVILPISQNPNPNLEEQLLDGDSSSFPSSDVIRSNHFSIESPIPNPKLAIEITLDSDNTTKDNESLSEIDSTASWMDPGQFPLSRVGKRRRNSSSESSDLSSDIESPSNSLSGEFDAQIENKEEDEEARDSEMKMVAEEEEVKGLKSSPEVVAWWRVPMEVIRYFVLRVSPVWSLSVAAAALMGFVLYRQRWMSKMKRKTQSIQLNVTVDDDKKVSQLMSRAARLNEAFSVVKRVPIIRPTISAPGFASWPVISLR